MKCNSLVLHCDVLHSTALQFPALDYTQDYAEHTSEYEALPHTLDTMAANPGSVEGIGPVDLEHSHIKAKLK